MLFPLYVNRISNVTEYFAKRNLLDFQPTSVPECAKYDSSTVQLQYTPIENSDFRQPSVSLQTEDIDLYFY
jgi:hypothetical protein